MLGFRTFFFLECDLLVSHDAHAHIKHVYACMGYGEHKKRGKNNNKTEKEHRRIRDTTIPVNNLRNKEKKKRHKNKTRGQEQQLQQCNEYCAQRAVT